jgi:hypothetical protein
MIANYRKIIVGDSFSNCVRYVKGSKYRLGGKECTLTDFLPSQKEGCIDIYVSNNGVQLLWKTIPEDQCLEVEHDVTFD